MEKVNSKTATIDTTEQTSVYPLLIYATIISIVSLVLHPTSTNMWLTGVVVNCVLIRSCFDLSRVSLIPLAMLPSITVTIKGLATGLLLFSSLAYLPVIWLGNLLMVSLFKTLAVQQKRNCLLALTTATVAKATLMTVFAYTFYNLFPLGWTFFLIMGPVQLVTAMTGGLLALGLAKWLSSKNTRAVFHKE